MGEVYRRDEGDEVGMAIGVGCNVNELWLLYI